SMEEVVEAEGFDLESLLYNWLESLLVMFDVNTRLYSKFEIESIKRTAEGYKLTARAWGEDYDSNKHEQKVGVKAVTYHMMSIEEKGGRWVLKFLLDL
ncbi:MAG: archease, partial [Nitrososphaerales archaeon]